MAGVRRRSPIPIKFFRCIAKRTRRAFQIVPPARRAFFAFCDNPARCGTIKGYRTHTERTFPCSCLNWSAHGCSARWRAQPGVLCRALLLLWEECRHTADYSISRAEAVSRAEDYFAALAKPPLALDADGAGDEMSSPPRDPPHAGGGLLLRLRRTGWLEEQPGSYEVSRPLPLCRKSPRCWTPGRDIEPPGGHLYRQAVQGVAAAGQHRAGKKSPYENVLREVRQTLRP